MSIPESARVTLSKGLTAVPAAEHLAAWRSLYERYEVPLGGYVIKILRRGDCFDPPDHGLDVRQEAWQRSALFFHQCDRSPRGWLFRIARHASLDHLKQCAEERRLGVAFNEAPEEGELLTVPSARLHSPEELYLHRIAFARQLSRLSAEQLIVLQLRDVGLDYQEIYLRTGISPVNARQMLHRAKVIIRAIAEEVH
jgi:DNA-directed RNA polymerase specialized sigma24 family protein